MHLKKRYPRKKKPSFHHNSETFNYASTHHDIVSGVWIMHDVVFHLVMTVTFVHHIFGVGVSL
jgi:hypothetical protein